VCMVLSRDNRCATNVKVHEFKGQGHDIKTFTTTGVFLCSALTSQRVSGSLAALSR